MDIVRDESVKKKKRQKQALMIVFAVIAILAATLGVSRLKPALQAVDIGTVWPDTVKRGSMMRQVRGLGSLVPIPEDVRLIPAETEVRVERILVLPGTPVKPDTIIMGFQILGWSRGVKARIWMRNRRKMSFITPEPRLIAIL